MNNVNVSVTELVETCSHQFDQEFWSTFKALEKILDDDKWNKVKPKLLERYKIPKNFLELYDLNPDIFYQEKNNIIKEWEDQKEAARQRGIAIHEQFENDFKSGDLSDDLLSLGFSQDKQFVNSTDLLSDGIYSEFPLSYELDYFTITGRPDLILVEDKEVTIVDFKTDKQLKKRGHFMADVKNTQKMKYPLNNVEDCNLSKYQLQLSLYAWLIEHVYPEFKVSKILIWHINDKINGEKVELEQTPDLVNRLIKNYEKEIIKKQQRAKFEPIIY